MRNNKEIAVARSMTDSLFGNVLATTSKEPTLAAYAAAFGDACKANDFIPDEASYHRILLSVLTDIGERRRAADRLNTCILKSTKELLQMQRRTRGRCRP